MNRRVNPYSEFLVPPSAVDRSMYITSTNHFHGVMSLLFAAWGFNQEEQQDTSESLLEEIFFCGYDWYDDFYPILSKVRIIDISDWLAGTRESILFPSYDPAVYFNGLAGGVNYRRRWCKDQSHSLRVQQITEMIESLWGSDCVADTGACCGWDSILIHNHERRVITDVAIFPWNLSTNMINKVHISSRKIRALKAVHQAYGVVPLQIIDTMSGIYWTDVSQVQIVDCGQVMITASGLPSDAEESSGISLDVLRPFGELKRVFKEWKNVDV